MQATYFSFKEDYYDIVEWWHGWKWKDVPKPSTLPATGIIIKNNGKKICNCFIYKTDSDWVIISWVLINPKATKQERTGCLEFMIKIATEECEKLGFKLIDVMIDNKVNFIQKLEEQGYIKTEILTRLIKKL